MSGLRRPSGIIWAVAVPFALLVGLAIGGLPDTSTDVPLRDRHVTEVTTPD